LANVTIYEALESDIALVFTVLSVEMERARKEADNLKKSLRK
jgi:hypothetical protein